MTIQVDFWQLVSLLLGFIGVLATFGKILLKQLDTRIEQQNERVGKLEAQLNAFLTKLPLEYQRREDAIRFETVLNAKLDAIGARIERLIERPPSMRRATD
ncbi:MAG: hypothetical protein LBL72_07310 [Candidatus Accumulibacter sp.]|jgi:HPt (histidine-containing phosphotransfer) domain-containing protein|nr:hypothetical protein [Accumulibacter sp.]